MYISFNISVAEMWLENVVDRPSCSQAMTSSNSIQSSWHSFSSPLVDMFNLKKDLKAGLSTLSKYSKNQFSPSILVGRFLTGPVQSVRVFFFLSFVPFHIEWQKHFKIWDTLIEREREMEHVLLERPVWYESRVRSVLRGECTKLDGPKVLGD